MVSVNDEKSSGPVPFLRSAGDDRGSEALGRNVMMWAAVVP
jgi:hypothetical protein